MRRITLVELIEYNKQQDRRMGLVTAGLQAVVNSEVEWFARFTLDGTRFKVGCAELTSAHGGLLLICTSVKQSGQRWSGDDSKRVSYWDRPYTTVNYLEDAERDYRSAPGEVGARMRVEIERALCKRNAAHNTLAAQDVAQ